MSRSIRWISLASIGAVVLLCRLEASAAQPANHQEWKYRGQVFGGAGWGGLYHGDNHQFSSLSLVGGIQALPFDRAWSGLGFEGRFDYLRSSDELYKDVKMASVNAIYHFGKSRVQPFVYGGICFLTGERTVVVTYATNAETSYQERHQDSVNKTGVNLGAGLRVVLTRQVSLRPELRMADTTPGKGYNLAIPQFLVSFAYTW